MNRIVTLLLPCLSEGAEEGTQVLCDPGIATLFSTMVFTPGRHWRLLPMRANGRPAFVTYRREMRDDTYRLYGLQVLDVVGGQIASVVTFLDLPGLASSSLAPFAFTPTLDVGITTGRETMDG